MSLSVRADYRFESKRYGTIINVNEIPARNLVNGRVTLRTGDYELAFWMDNIFDDRTPIQIGLISQPGIGVNPLTTIYGDKRTFGVTGSVRF